jgi:hypothetical protein
MKYHLKPLNVFSWIVLTLAFGFLLLVGWWLVYPYQTIDIQSAKVLTPIVAKGEDLEIEVIYNKHANLPSTVTKDLINGDIVHIPSSGISNVPIGQNKVITHQIIPYESDLGEARLKETITYQVNPLRTITKEFITDKFTIIDKPDVDIK